MLDKKIDNCLNLIRILAAVQVLLGHTFGHLQVPSIQWLYTLMSFFPGVPLFFTLSGFLIWRSVGGSATYREYLSKRFLRIYPELWIAVIVELAVMICLYKEPIPLLDLGLFSFTQGTIMQFWTPDSMRGYGCGTPNGSLWTICAIIQFYIIVWFLYKVLHGKKKVIWGLTLVATLLCPVCIYLSERILPLILYKLLNQTIFAYLWLFMIGVCCSEFQEKILPFLKKYWAVCLLLSMIYMWGPVKIPYCSYNIVSSPLLFFTWLGFAYRFPVLNIRCDISYGLYIYHMTVVNAMIAMGYTSKNIYVVVVLIISCILAYVSTITIGKYSQKLKKKIIAGNPVEVK